MSEECRVCLVEHDPAIHAATLSIHKHIRARLLRLFQPLPQPKPRTDNFQPPGPGLLVAMLREARYRGSKRGGKAQKK